MFSRLSAGAALIAACVSAVAIPAPASGYVTPEQAQLAADRAVAWYRTAQSADGNLAGFGGDWSMIALSNAGVNAADLRTTALAPSLQDHFAGAWAGNGPGDASTDQARALLVGHGGGIRGAQLAANRNVLARQLEYFTGDQLGLKTTVNDDMWGLLALQRNGIDDLTPTLEKEIRRVQVNGGWNYTTAGGQPDIDMTGAGIGTLCAAGATPDDPAVGQALDYVKTMQDPATGGFISDFFGVNTDSTAWVVNGLRECGIDPQAPGWTTEQGKTPLDFLVAMQKPNGAFRWHPSEPHDSADNLYATQDAVTALVGDGFGADPAPRKVAGDPVFRPAPAVAAGSVVPMGLIVDHGPAVEGAERACSLEAPVGGTVADVLQAAGDALPQNCARDVELEGSGADQRLVAVNGVAADPERRWVLSVNGGAPRETLDAEVDLGATVRAVLVGRDTGPGLVPAPRATPAEHVLPRVVPITGEPPRRAKAALNQGSTLRLRNGRVRIAVRCPRGLGATGCRGVVKVRAEVGRRTRVVGIGQYAVASGDRKLVTVRLQRSFRRLVARSGRKGRQVRIEAATRDQATGGTTRSRAAAVIRG